MQLRAVELRLVDLELVRSLATGIGTHARRPVVLVRVETTNGVGLGECAALEEPTYTAEYAAGAFGVLAEHLAPRLLAGGATYPDTPAALERLAAIRGHEMAKAALEMALLDAELRAGGVPLADYLGATRAAIAGGATIGIGSVEEVLVAVDEAAAAGYRRIKVKVAPPGGDQVLAAVRREYPDLALAADANGTYRTGRDDRELAALGDLGLAFVEQPLEDDDLSGSARLVAAGLPVVLDESVVSLADLDRALAAGACTGVSIKPARVGGLLAGRALAVRAAAAGISVTLGGMLETGLGRAAALCLAGRPEFDLPSDLGASDRYFVPDLTPAHELVDGMLLLPTAPGLGVAIDTELVERHTVADRRVVRA